MQEFRVVLGISNRHVHLSREDVDALFGPGYQLTNIKNLGQPGQFACEETVTLVGPKSSIPNVRVLGPERKESQVEISISDAIKLGVKVSLRGSGDLEGTDGLTLKAPNGQSVDLARGAIVAARHIHATEEDVAAYGLKDGDMVKVKFEGDRGGILNDVLLRVTKTSALEFHVDIEEANCMNAKNGDQLVVLYE